VVLALCALLAGAAPAHARALLLGCAEALRAAGDLRPGDRLLLRRGSRCAGTLTVATPRVVVGAYGRGPCPRIDAQGAEAVLLRDVDRVVVQDLELTNAGPEARRRGVRVVVERGVARGITLRRLWIHDVDGDLAKGRNGSGGISLEATGPPPARFDGLRVLRNRIERVSRSGISMVGTLDPARPDADTPWPSASTRVRIARNRIDLVGGDGIVPRGTVGAVVAHNVVSRGNLRGSPLLGPTPVCNAGIWTFHANRTQIRHNEVFGMESHDCDGTGFDVDYDQDGTVVEGNYSHDNEGGFILLCADDEPRHRAEVRFNLSVDDAATLSTVPCRAPYGRVGDLSGIRVTHNTVVAPRPRLVAEHFELPVLVGAGSLLFANNVVVATEPQTAPFPCGPNCTHNLFAGMPPAGEAAIEGPPGFLDPRRRGRGRLPVGRGFRVRARSPGVGAGLDLGGAPRDYFGRPVAPGPPTVGFAAPARAR
jgi:hypothetical protein